jgi:hypothetical protein
MELKKAPKKYPTTPKRVHELWDRVVVEWNRIPPETCQRLIESIPRRVQELLEQKVVIPSINCRNKDSKAVGQKTVPMSDYFV